MDEHADGFAGGMLGIEAEKRGQEVGAVRQAGGLLVDDFDLVALQDGDIHELFGFLAAAMLDDQEAGRDDFEDEAGDGQVARGAPDEELAAVAPDAEVNAGTLDGGREAGERLGGERQGSLEQEGLPHSTGRHEGQRDARHVAFLAPEAGPEGRFDNGLDGGSVGDGRGGFVATQRRGGEVAREVRMDPAGSRPGGGIGGGHHRAAPGSGCAGVGRMVVLILQATMHAAQTKTGGQADPPEGAGGCSGAMGKGGERGIG